MVRPSLDDSPDIFFCFFGLFPRASSLYRETKFLRSRKQKQILENTKNETKNEENQIIEKPPEMTIEPQETLKSTEISEISNEKLLILQKVDVSCQYN